MFEVVVDRGQRLRGSWSYVVDQSCVRSMLVELDALLVAAGVSSREDA